MTTSLILALTLSTACTQAVTLKRSAYNVEIASASAVAAERLECRELEMLSVSTRPSERSQSPRLSVAEIKARNLGAERGATHLVWQSREEFACSRNGDRLPDDPNRARACARLSAMAYQCMIGRAP